MSQQEVIVNACHSTVDIIVACGVLGIWSKTQISRHSEFRYALTMVMLGVFDAFNDGTYVTIWCQFVFSTTSFSMLHTWVYLCVFVPVFIAIPPTKPYAIFCVLHHFISVLYLSTYILCLDVQAYPPIYWLTPRRYRGSKYWSNIIMSGTEWSFRHCYYPSTFTCMSLFSSEIFTTYCACVVCVCPLSDICHASL